MSELVKQLRVRADYWEENWGATKPGELYREAADLIERLTGPDTGYATGYQIGYACGKADGEREAAKDTNVPANIVVEVKGGMVQNVYADRRVDVEVADLDVQDDLDFRIASEKIEEAQKLGWTRVW